MISKKHFNTLVRKGVVVSGLLLSIAVTVGCSNFAKSQDQGLPKISRSVQKTGVQLWAENCVRCHNIRPIDSYSDSQWDVAMLHMRVRANLTAEDAKAISEYLKASN